MRLIRKQSKKIAFFLAVSFMFTACTQNEEVKLENKKKYSGEDIINGIFFYKNEITEGIPQLALLKSKIEQTDNHDEISKTMDEFSKLTIDFINVHYPEFFDDLQKTVYSGNLYAISAVLDQASRYIEQAGLSSDKYRSAFLLGKRIINDDNLKKQISELDLSTSQGLEKLKNIIDDANKPNISGKKTCVVTVIAGAVAFVYIGVVGVSIAIGAYSVYFKVAYWGPLEEKMPELEDEFLHKDDDFNIEREALIAQTSDFFEN